MQMDPAKTLTRKIALARAAMALEDVWAAIWPAMMVAGAFLLIVLLGAFAMLPAGWGYAVMAAFALAFIVALKPLLALRLRSRDEALHRIEQVSGARHRPATAYMDRLAGPEPSSASRAIWQVHRERAARQIARLKPGWPRSRLAYLDPYATRNTLMIALIAVGILTWGQWDDRAASIAGPAGAAKQQVELDAWIAPPAYTGKPPVLLTGRIAAGNRDGGEGLLVPQGSTLVVRVNGAGAPALTVARPLEDGSPGDTLNTLALEPAGSGSVHELRYQLERPVHVAISDGETGLGGWLVSIIPDALPDVRITGEVSLTASGGFAVPWEASDDYGLSGITAQFKLATDNEFMTGGNALEYEPPASPVNLRALRPRKADGRTFMDFSEHPWAGMKVEMRLHATDLAGQTGVSEPVVMSLPQRDFRKPMARALIEQRRNLVGDTATGPLTVRALSGLMAWPDGLLDKSAHYLGTRLIASRLYGARDETAFKEAVKLMWDVAVSIEDGDLSDALKRLEAIRKELQQALAEGAPEERIAELMQQMREALNEYLEAMARQMREAMKNGEQMQSEQLDPSQMVESQDLQKMLDMIENLARQGARDAAQEMLSQLENLMKNLRMGLQQQPGQQGNSPMQQMMRELGEMMQRQQQLMDDTFRLPQGQNGEGQQMQPGQQQRPGQQGEFGNRPGDLADQQRALERMLDQMMQQLGRQGMDQPGGLERSQGAMRDAEGALRDGDRSTALDRQGEAMDGLREGAQNMARQMQQQGQGTAGNFGRNGEARGNRDDPLGRPSAQRGEDFGQDRNIVPSEAAIERARRILETLRSRANNPDRPRIELDYIDRLLRGLY